MSFVNKVSTMMPIWLMMPLFRPPIELLIYPNDLPKRGVVKVMRFSRGKYDDAIKAFDEAIDLYGMDENLRICQNRNQKELALWERACSGRWASNMIKP